MFLHMRTLRHYDGIPFEGQNLLSKMRNYFPENYGVAERTNQWFYTYEEEGKDPMAFISKVVPGKFIINIDQKHPKHPQIKQDLLRIIQE